MSMQALTLEDSMNIKYEIGLSEGVDIGEKIGRKEGRREGRREGRKEGHREGRKEEQKIIARNMLLNNVDRQTVVLYTGLSVEEVDDIIKDIK